MNILRPRSNASGMRRVHGMRRMRGLKPLLTNITTVTGQLLNAL
jgi:hypothetical protein